MIDFLNCLTNACIFINLKFVVDITSLLWQKKKTVVSIGQPVCDQPIKRDERSVRFRSVNRVLTCPVLTSPQCTTFLPRIDKISFASVKESAGPPTMNVRPAFLAAIIPTVASKQRYSLLHRLNVHTTMDLRLQVSSMGRVVGSRSRYLVF